MAFAGVFLGLFFEDLGVFVGLDDFLLFVEAGFLDVTALTGVLLGVATFFKGVFLGLTFFAEDLLAAGVFIISAIPSKFGVCAFAGVFFELFLADFGVFLGLLDLFLLDFCVEAGFLGVSAFTGVLLGVVEFETFLLKVFPGLAFFDGDFLAAGVFINSAMPSKLGVSSTPVLAKTFKGVFSGLLVGFGVFMGLFFTAFGVFLGVAAFLAGDFLGELLAAAGVFIMAEMPSKLGVPTESFFLAAGDAFLADLGVPAATVALRVDLLSGETNISRGMLGVWTAEKSKAVLFKPGVLATDFGVFFGLAALLADLGVFFGLSGTDFFAATLGVFLGLRDLLLIGFGVATVFATLAEVLDDLAADLGVTLTGDELVLALLLMT